MLLDNQLDWCQPRYADAPVTPIGEDAVQATHAASMTILENLGVLFLNDAALSIFESHGCQVECNSKRVRMDRAWVMEQVASPPNVMDLDQGRRIGVRADFQNFLKLVQAYNCIHFSCGYPVEPMDLHPSIRHLDGLFDKLTLTDKVVHAYALVTERIEDAMEMVRIAAGLTH